MWLKQCHRLSMTGNGKHTTYTNGDDWGIVYKIVLTTLVYKLTISNNQATRFPNHHLSLVLQGLVVPFQKPVFF